MPVPTTMQDLSVIAASNSPNGATDTPSALDDHQRALGAILRRSQAVGAPVASAATVNIGSVVDGDYIHITGTTTITSFGSPSAATGIRRVLVFDGALTLTQSGNLLLPGGNNITTTAGATAEVCYEGSGVWRMLWYSATTLPVSITGNAASANAGPGNTPFGHRNKIMNGNFDINQRGVSGTVVLAAFEYGHDRWKAGAGGCTYTFATSGGVTTITITAGALAQQMDEGFHAGTHVLSWTGTAQGTLIDVTGSSGITRTITPGVDAPYIEFGTGTVSKVQLEPGSTPTPFEVIPAIEERRRCMPYTTVISNLTGSTGHILCAGLQSSTTKANGAFVFPVRMREAPTITLSAAADFAVRNAVMTKINATAVSALEIENDSARLVFDVASGLTAGNATLLEMDLTSASIIIDAEI